MKLQQQSENRRNVVNKCANRIDRVCVDSSGELRRLCVVFLLLLSRMHGIAYEWLKAQHLLFSFCVLFSFFASDVVVVVFTRNRTNTHIPNVTRIPYYSFPCTPLHTNDTRMMTTARTCVFVYVCTFDNLFVFWISVEVRYNVHLWLCVCMRTAVFNADNHICVHRYYISSTVWPNLFIYLRFTVSSALLICFSTISLSSRPSTRILLKNSLSSSFARLISHNNVSCDTHAVVVVVDVSLLSVCY